MISYPFESQNTGTPAAPVYDRAITAEQERTFNKLRYINGVFQNPTNSLQVVAENAMTVGVMPGGAHIEGALGYEPTKRLFTLADAHSSLSRIDRIVVRFDTSVTERKIDIYKKEGTPSTTPVPPEVVQQSNYYEIALGDIRVSANATSVTNSNIRDQRANSAVCGIVVPAIPTPLDLTSLYAQYQASLDQYLETVRQALNGTLAGGLQVQIDDIRDRIGNLDDDNPLEISKGGTGARTQAAALSAMLGTSAIPIANGGTGATNAASGLLNLGGISKKKVWTNSSLGSAFAPQTIAMTIAPTDRIKVRAIPYSGQPYSTGEIEVACGNSAYVNTVSGTSSETAGLLYVTKRLVTVTTTGVTFGGGYYVTSTGQWTALNGRAIPAEIYLVKGVQ